MTLQGCLMVQVSCWSSSHLVYISGRKQEEHRKPKSKDLHQLSAPLQRSLTQSPPSNSNLHFINQNVVTWLNQAVREGGTSSPFTGHIATPNKNWDLSCNGELHSLWNTWLMPQHIDFKTGEVFPGVAVHLLLPPAEMYAQYKKLFMNLLMTGWDARKLCNLFKYYIKRIKSLF